LAVNGAQPGGNESRNAAMGGTSIALPLDAGTFLTSKAQTFLLGFHYTF
jgi:hypothetical protein